VGGASGSAGAVGGAGGATSSDCVASIYGQYVVRTDGLALYEGPTESPVIDNASGIDATPLQGIQAIAEGAYSACGLVEGGTAYCWAQDANNGNSDGQLGNGNTSPLAIFHATPVMVGASTQLANVVSIAAGEVSNAACAITADGHLWCWGQLDWLVNGGSPALHAPYAQQMTTDGTTPLTNVLQVTLGSEFACAMVQGTPNTVWCWGFDQNGELGQGNTTSQKYPVKVSGLASPKKVVSSYDGYTGVSIPMQTACAIDGDGVYCWGRNDMGAIGADSASNPVLPITLVTTMGGSILRGVTDLQAGLDGFAVLRTDGTIWAWGAPGGNQAYASDMGATQAVALGWAGGSVAFLTANVNLWSTKSTATLRYLTQSGAYYSGKSTVAVTCGTVP